MNKENNKAAFTLAEVLITLVIIGIIAAITVPSLINKTNNQETVSKLEKAYSTLAQATNSIIAEEGPVKTWTTSTDNIYMLYKKKLKNAKECDSSSGCMSPSYQYLSGGNTSNRDADLNHRKLVLVDGVQVMGGVADIMIIVQTVLLIIHAPVQKRFVSIFLLT